MSIESTGIVKFGDYSIGAKSAGSKNSKLKDENAGSLAPAEAKSTSVNPEKVLDSLSMQGVYNRAQVVKADKKEVNPADYLSEERITDIEAMMGEFDNGVNHLAERIQAEFPSISKETTYALAARIFAVE